MGAPHLALTWLCSRLRPEVAISQLHTWMCELFACPFCPSTHPGPLHLRLSALQSFSVCLLCLSSLSPACQAIPLIFDLLSYFRIRWPFTLLILSILCLFAFVCCFSIRIHVHICIMRLRVAFFSIFARLSTAHFVRGIVIVFV
jgi:hypothetical protein